MEVKRTLEQQRVTKVGSPENHVSGEKDLCFLSKLARRFVSRRRTRLAAVGRVVLRGLVTRCCACRRCARRSKATSRLARCDRRSVAVTVIPLGRWVSRTPGSTLLRGLPPGSLAMENFLL